MEWSGGGVTNHCCQHCRRDNLSASKQNAIREATAQKKQAKKEQRELRRRGSSPEEVRLLAQTFHLLVHQHSKIGSQTADSQADEEGVPL